MRLLRTSTLTFEDFFNPPDYAILSHRWSQNEVSYEDFVSGRHNEREGYTKIQQCCTFARSRGRKYVWIDSCCIDKRSSAELSEAINSMWQWYADAKECYAYLVDIERDDENRLLHASKRRASEWFSRGWTLQELLAPRVLIFVDKRWKEIGRKSDQDIQQEVSNITSIPERCLVSHFSLSQVCIAQKLSWASKRITTRKEDIAYCLLGLVGVNMPLLYGEGEKAFLRLQQEIIRQTDDESIFAWRYVAPPANYISGVLAPEIKLFAHSGDVRSLDLKRQPYQVTNKGLDLDAYAEKTDNGNGVYVIPLNCEYGGGPRPTYRCAIAVREERNAYSRVSVESLGHQLDIIYTSRIVANHGRFLIRLSRWQNEYEPAVVIIKAFADRLRVRAPKERRETMHGMVNLLANASVAGTVPLEAFSRTMLPCLRPTKD